MPAENESKRAPGTLLPCPCCGEAQASISLNLSDATLHCADCDADFDLDFIRLLLAKWAEIVKWIEAMPSSDD